MWRDGTGAPFAIVEAESGLAPGSDHALRSGWSSGHLRLLGRARGARPRYRHALAPALAEWTFATTSVIRLHVFIMVGNEVSERMVERAGYQREGVLRAWDVLDDGVPVDCVVYSCLRSDV